MESNRERQQMTSQTCTVVTHGQTRCGATAAVSGTFSDGTEWGCCADHATEADYRAAGVKSSAGEYQVGEVVNVYRYGKAYRATVTHVGARGAAYATFRYGNGAERTVRVEG